jgi:exonuclease III
MNENANDRRQDTPSTLRILQQNINKSRKFIDHFNNGNPHRHHDIICFQEPYIDSTGNPRATSQWRVIYPTIRTKATGDTARAAPYRAVTLVNKAIATDSYSQIPFPSKDVVIVQTRGETPDRRSKWTCTIINVYNDLKSQTTLEQLASFLERTPRQARDHVVLLGDFNRHHALWEPESNTHLTRPSNEEEAKPLIDILANNSLIMTLPKGVYTLELKNTHTALTRPDNVFCSPEAANSLTKCKVQHGRRGPGADHYPIVTILALSVEKAAVKERRNFCEVEWKEFKEELAKRMGREDRSWKPGVILDEGDFVRAVDNMVEDIQRVVEVKVPMARWAPEGNRWWTKELKMKRKEHARADREARLYRWVEGHESKERLKRVAKEYKAMIKEVKRKKWDKFLGQTTDGALMWRAEKIVTRPYGDGGAARMPDLVVRDAEGNEQTISTNTDKSTTLREVFFPPAPTRDSTSADDDEEPEPIAGFRRITDSQIRRAIERLEPHKAPGPDGIPNVILKKNLDILLPHLRHIFNAVLTHGFYHQSWRDHTTVVLRKPGKSLYSAPNAYRPIALYSTIGKVLTAIMAEALTYVTEQFQLLPANHFGGRPRQSTSEALHYLTSSIKNAWRQKRVLSVLFLDISGAFPNAVTLQLLKNLRSRRVPKAIVDFVSLMLASRRTQLTFDDYTSEWIELNNGIGQGDPMLMILYLYYSAGLLEVVKKSTRGGETEDSEAWVDDTALFVATKTEKEGARRLVDIMEREGGAFEWSERHNSKFDVPKFAYMCFTRRPQGTDGVVINLRGKEITPAAHHKHLGVVLDQALRWHQQADAAIAKATKWILLFRRLANTWRGTRPEQMRNLYMAVAVPKALYAADVWITSPSKLPGAKQTSGSVGFVRRLETMQKLATPAIIGAFKNTAADVLNAHSFIPPMELQVSKACH